MIHTVYYNPIFFSEDSPEETKDIRRNWYGLLSNLNINKNMYSWIAEKSHG